MARIESYFIRDARGRYYRGNMEDGEPVCDTFDQDDAMEMTPEEIKTDFPNGLPAGWTKEEP